MRTKDRQGQPSYHYRCPTRATKRTARERRAWAFPAGSGLATATHQEPGLPGPPRRPAPPCALRHPWPASPLSWLACPASPLWSRPQAAGPTKGGQGAGRWLHGQALSYASRGLSCRPCAASCLAQPERRTSGAAFWPCSPPPVPEKRDAGAAGVSSERSSRLARPQASGS
jgi:hypothetical protein